MEHTIVIPQLGGVTTALVLFALACLLYPAAIKNRAQFYAGFVAVLVMVFLFSLDVMIRQPGFQVFSGAVTGLLQLFALVMFFMSAGGMSVGELADDLKHAYEVVRRGEEAKTVIIPLGSQKVGSASAPQADEAIVPHEGSPPSSWEGSPSIPLEPKDPGTKDGQ